MKFHLIYDSSNTSNFQGNKVSGLLQSACATHNIECVLHDVQQLDLFQLPALGHTDLLYRAAIAGKAVEAQRRMISSECTSFHADWEMVFNGESSSYFLHAAHELPAIPSFSGIPQTENEILQCVEQLGPFPLIVKVTGNSLGVGVMRVDSIESLRSVLDYLKSLKVDVLIRKYIDHDYYVRAIVVGDQVVASHAAYAMSGDFRTNTGDDTHQKREARVLTPEQQVMVVESVRVLGVETGGVDLLFDTDDNPFIAEVNFPNNFSVTQGVTGIDIASKMVQYLMKKAQTKLD